MMKKLLFLSVLFFYVEIKCLFDVQKGEYLKIFKIHVFETRGLISSIQYDLIIAVLCRFLGYEAFF